MSKYHTAAAMLAGGSVRVASRLSRSRRADVKERLDDTVKTNRKATDDLRQAVAERAQTVDPGQPPDRIRQEGTDATNAREGG